MPESEAFVVCAKCGAIQSKVKEALEKKTEASLVQLRDGPDSKTAKINRQFRWFAIVVGAALLWALAYPGYVRYTEQVRARTSSTGSAAATRDAAKRPDTGDRRAFDKSGFVADLKSHTENVRRTMLDMEFTPHADLPKLIARIDATISSVSAMEWPSCLEAAKTSLLSAFIQSRSAIEINRLRGNGISDPAVVRQVQSANDSVSDARRVFSEARCVD